MSPRPLLAGAVLVVAALPGPAQPPAVVMTAAGTFGRVAGVGFDPGRRAVWVVTDGPTAELLHLSYPDLKHLARYRLGVAAGPVAFDPAANRMFLAVRPADAPPAVWPTGRGELRRYDLGRLVQTGTGPTTAVVPERVLPGTDRAVTALAVTADGEWLTAVTRGDAVALVRVPAHFQDPADFHAARTVADVPVCAHRLVPAAVGAGVWYGGAGGWRMCDAATGEVGAPAAAPRDGDEGFVGLTADARYLFRAAAGRLTLHDVTGTAAPPALPLPPGDAGPFWVAPDGGVVVFRTGRLVRVAFPAGAAPVVVPPPPRAARAEVAPVPRPVTPAPAAPR